MRIVTFLAFVLGSFWAHPPAIAEENVSLAKGKNGAVLMGKQVENETEISLVGQLSVPGYECSDKSCWYIGVEGLCDKTFRMDGGSPLLSTSGNETVANVNFEGTRRVHVRGCRITADYSFLSNEKSLKENFSGLIASHYLTDPYDLLYVHKIDCTLVTSRSGTILSLQDESFEKINFDGNLNAWSKSEEALRLGCDATTWIGGTPN